jgi:hypothetical protein
MDPGSAAHRYALRSIRGTQAAPFLIHNNSQQSLLQLSGDSAVDRRFNVE